MKEMTFDEMAEMYCNRQLSEPVELKDILLTQKNNYNPIGFMLLECQMMDSSLCGGLVILPYGPNNTFKEIPTHPISPRGLASDMSTVVGFLRAENLVRDKWDYSALSRLIASRAELASKTLLESKTAKGKHKKTLQERARTIQAAVEVAGQILGEHTTDEDKEHRIKAVFLQAICG